jgi:hypothetical protein
MGSGAEPHKHEDFYIFVNELDEEMGQNVKMYTITNLLY